MYIRFLCQECGYRARSSANLRGHVKARHEARQFACDICNKSFSSGNNLKNHMRIHTGEVGYHGHHRDMLYKCSKSLYCLL